MGRFLTQMALHSIHIVQTRHLKQFYIYLSKKNEFAKIEISFQILKIPLHLKFF